MFLIGLLLWICGLLSVSNAALQGATTQPGAGAYGGLLYSVCTTDQSWVYVGCYETESVAINAPFPFQVKPFDVNEPPTGYPRYNYYSGLLLASGLPAGGWVEGSSPGTASPNLFYYENSVNPANCSMVCRAHGYKVVALMNQECYCGSSLPSGFAKLNTSSTGTVLNPQKDIGLLCHSSTACPGDASQFCKFKFQFQYRSTSTC